MKSKTFAYFRVATRDQIDCRSNDLPKRLVDVALYCRVDNGGSRESRQLAFISQKSILETFAQKNGLSIKFCYEDIGYSGHDLSRPGLKKMIADYESWKFSTVLVTDFSRLYRGNIFSFALPFPVYVLDQLMLIQPQKA